MKKQWSTIAGQPILTDEKEKSLGSMKGAFINPESGQIIGFLVGYTKVLVPSDIEKWHSTWVQVGGEEALAPALDIYRIEQYGLRRSFFNGKKVQSKSGKKLGRVRDFCFESTTHSVLTFESSKKFLNIEWNKRIFPIEDIQEITEQAIILKVEPEQRGKQKSEITLPATSPSF